MIKIKAPGNFGKAFTFLEKLKNFIKRGELDKYGRMGVEALREATPKDTGKTSDSWSYIIKRTDEKVSIEWTNSNVNDGVNIAVILQYGHGTNNGGYVVGVDYINPAMKDVFNSIANDAWKEIKNL